MIKTIITTLAALTLLADIGLLVLLLSWLMDRIIKPDIIRIWREKSQRFFEERGLVLIFIISLAATLSSLFFSEIALFAPCKLCWFQRVFMYPLPILTGLALWRKDKGIIPYVLPLSIIGGVFALYHYTEQVRAALRPVDPLSPCDLTGVSCAATPFFYFGYITIPMMSLTAFILITLIAYLTIRGQKTFLDNKF